MGTGNAPCTAMVRSEDVVTPWVIREGISVPGCSHISQLKVWAQVDTNEQGTNVLLQKTALTVSDFLVTTGFY